MRFDNTFTSYLILSIIVITLGFLIYSSYKDYRYRVFERLVDFLVFYPFIFYANYKIVNNFLITLISFSFLFVVFYVTEVINPKENIGTIDILVAPLFTVWFNQYSIYFSFIFLALYFMTWVPYINKNILNRGKNTISVPMIPVMLLTFIVSYVLFPNSIKFYFSTF